MLPYFRGVAVHDCWQPYWKYDQATHSVCCAHLLRELIGIKENHPKQVWGPLFLNLLLRMKAAKERSIRLGKNALSKSQRVLFSCLYDNHKAMLGNHNNYRMGANVVELDFPRSRSLDDLMKTCTMARGQVMLQAQPENSLWAMKQKKALYTKMDQIPLEMKLGLIAKSAGSPRWSISISYANSRSFGPLDPYIDEFYVLSEPGVSDIICEIACINHTFFLAIAQTFSADEFVEVFLGELASVGIGYEVVGKEPLRLCGIKAYGSTTEE